MSTPIGQPVSLTAQFTDDDGNLVDPTAVTYTITLPDATVVTGSAVKDSIGVYHYDYTTVQAGQHQYYFTGTGSNPGVTAPDVFTVAGLSTGSLISLAEARTFNQIRGTGNDTQLLSFIRSATAIIDAQCGYTIPTQFTETATASIDGVGRRVLILSRTPVLSVQSVTPRMIGMPSVDISTLLINAESGIIYLANWFTWFGPQQVAYTAGRTFIPHELRDACQIIVAWLWESQRGGSVAVPNMGGEDPSVLTGMPGFPTRAFDLMRLAGRYAAPGLA